MPIYKTKNEKFFKKWTPKMAYVLGFFTADGSMIGNELFLKKLKLKLNNLISIRGSLNYYGNAWRLSYSTNDSKKIFDFMYKNHKKLIYLERKYNIYKKAINYYLGR